MARIKSSQFDDIRASILDAAAALFARQGFRNTNIIDIGRACNASKSRMYHYFTSKEAMLDEMLVQHVATLVAQAGPVAEGPADPRERLRDYFLLHLRHYYEQRDRHTVLIEDADHLSASARDEVRRLEQKLVDMLEGLLREINPVRFGTAAKTGADRTRTIAHAMLIYGMLNWTYTWYRPSGRLSLDALADQATAMCLHGVDDPPTRNQTQSQPEAMMTPALHEPHADDFQSLDQLHATQDRKLRAMGERLARSPDWCEHLKRAGVAPTDLRDRASLAAIPTLEKADLRARYPFPMLTTPIEEVARFCATSGTTGLPVMFGFTRHDWEATLVQQLARIYRTVGVTPGDRVYQGYGYGLWIGGPSMDVALNAYGAVNFPVGPGRADLMVQWLADHAYTVTTMSPLWLMTLLTAAKKAGFDPARQWALRVGLFGGQSVSATFRAEIEAQMPPGFMAHNIYGTTEAGGPILGISCPHSHAHDQMHLINEDSVLTEIVDPETMQPVGPGETGEIVITTLDKQASPVLRWRTRDLVRLADQPYACACGRKAFPLIGRIIGRSDDMLKVRGVMVFPTQVEDVIAGIEGLAKEAWQIYIDGDGQSLDQMEVAVERVPSATMSAEALAAEVAARLRARLGLTVSVACHADGTLPRYEAKAVRVIRRAGDQG